MKKAFYSVAILLLAFSFAQPVYSQAAFAEDSPAKDDVEEAIFRYFIAQYNHSTSVVVFCISAERPLSDRFIRRFSESRPLVLRASDCGRSVPGVWHARKLGDEGLNITISSFRWVSGETAETKAGLSSIGALWSVSTLRIAFKQGHWKIVSVKVDYEF